MRYRHSGLLIPKITFKAPVEFLRNPNLDENMLAVVCLFVFGGFTMKAAWSLIYHPRCSANSIPVQVSLFFQRKEIKELVELFRNYYMEYPFINPKCYHKR